jgi:hypothetical protein
MPLLDRAEFDALFAGFTSSAFRLETRPAYDQPEEHEPRRRWAAGQPPDDRWAAGYWELLRRVRAEGRRIERVRVLADPPTDYQRWVLDLAERCAIPLGEDARALPAGDAAAAGLGGLPDFWLFDDQAAAVLKFDGDRFAGARLVDDPAELDRLRDARRRAWDAARPRS